MPPPAPAPPGAELPLIVLLVMTIGPVVTLKMPPPLAVLPLIVNRFATGPWNVRLLSSTSSAEVSVIGLVTWLMSKVIVLPGQALLMIARREPAPLSLSLVTKVDPQLTVMVAVAVLPPRPAFELLVEACTWKLKVLDRKSVV